MSSRHAAEPVPTLRSGDAVAAVEQAIADLFRLAYSPRIQRARAARLGLEMSRTGWEMVRRIDDLGSVTVTGLADLMDLSLATTSRTLRDLETAGLLIRQSDPNDGRVARFTTSAAGREARARFQRATQDDIAAVLDSWPAAERDELARLFSLLVADMQAAVDRT